MFKILHYPYANEILMIAMTVEALIFFLSAFHFSDEENRKEETGISFRENNVSSYNTSPEEKIKHLSEQFDQVATFLNNIHGASDEIERHTLNYSIQMRQMERNLKEMNQLYQNLLSQLQKQDTIDKEDETENEILI